MCTLLTQMSEIKFSFQLLSRGPAGGRAAPPSPPSGPGAARSSQTSRTTGATERI